MLRLSTSRASAALVVFFIFLFVLAECSSDSKPIANCSRQCVAERCDNVFINYGKYCGAGYTGCPGEAPCDDLDACCRNHDDCVDKFGMLHLKCHKRLRNCMARVQKSGKPGFSKTCPVSQAASTMIKGLDLAILLGRLVDKKGH
ncbi:probable phospholipase A2 homolog 1 [Neltuma alba]|uniref:probable phospholipase A2 homolog 1 n=1 Tax=Neltuma alba TaxID=207710 RepID=UPI0010A3F484|nr:probable phospholipase A2 homolog 1 [Prosopis alba]XP_028806462.1 probable phospholipase A2 homolog 1 [Prosopis alba]